MQPEQHMRPERQIAELEQLLASKIDPKYRSGILQQLIEARIKFRKEISK